MTSSIAPAFQSGGGALRERGDALPFGEALSLEPGGAFRLEALRTSNVAT
jgi:hypothetical protein